MLIIKSIDEHRPPVVILRFLITMDMLFTRKIVIADKYIFWAFIWQNCVKRMMPQDNNEW